MHYSFLNGTPCIFLLEMLYLGQSCFYRCILTVHQGQCTLLISDAPYQNFNDQNSKDLIFKDIVHARSYDSFNPLFIVK